MAGEWQYSQPFLDKMKATEGWSSRPFWDYQQYSIGYGTRAQPGDFAPGFSLSRADGEARMAAELDKARAAVQARFPNLSPSQVEGLTSFTYNLGPGWMKGSNVAAALDKGDFAGASRAMQGWNHAGGVANAGLTTRRGWEGAMLTTPGGDPIGSMLAYNAQPNGSKDQIASLLGGGNTMMRLGAPLPVDKGGSINGGMGMSPVGVAGSPSGVDEANFGRQSFNHNVVNDPQSEWNAAHGVNTAASPVMAADFGRLSTPGGTTIAPTSGAPPPSPITTGSLSGGKTVNAGPSGPTWADLMQQQMLSGRPALQGTLDAASHGPINKSTPQYKNALISMLGGFF